MGNLTIKHNKNPREEEIWLGSDYGSGICLRVGRTGIYAYGYYDSCVGIEGGFVSWDEIEQFRDMANMKYKDVVELKWYQDVDPRPMPKE